MNSACQGLIEEGMGCYHDVVDLDLPPGLDKFVDEYLTLQNQEVQEHNVRVDQQGTTAMFEEWFPHKQTRIGPILAQYGMLIGLPGTL